MKRVPNTSDLLSWVSLHYCKMRAYLELSGALDDQISGWVSERNEILSATENVSSFIQHWDSKEGLSIRLRNPRGNPIVDLSDMQFAVRCIYEVVKMLELYPRQVALVFFTTLLPAFEKNGQRQKMCSAVGSSKLQLLQIGLFEISQGFIQTVLTC